ncbi:hypothetical protein [uncultured Deinococcus sp.]|uniref:hypothetical protein n=1 Tax=uncultured Deinococcus sp. TaxID=158789 RepID=UPI0025FBC368|nr:hypothetical protein [uncultured Deinococcus sp.]
MTGVRPGHHRLSMSILQPAVWRYHRDPRKYRDGQDVVHPRGGVVSHETQRGWRLMCRPPFADGLRQREPWRRFG